jgi:hypothetical protein
MYPDRTSVRWKAQVRLRGCRCAVPALTGGIVSGTASNSAASSRTGTTGMVDYDVGRESAGSTNDAMTRSLRRLGVGDEAGWARPRVPPSGTRSGCVRAASRPLTREEPSPERGTSRAVQRVGGATLLARSSRSSSGVNAVNAVIIGLPVDLGLCRARRRWLGRTPQTDGPAAHRCAGGLALHRDRPHRFTRRRCRGGRGRRGDRCGYRFGGDGCGGGGGGGGGPLG